MQTPKSLFIIDDDLEDVSLFSEAVQMIGGGIHFNYAHTFEEAVLKLTDSIILPDVILLDLNMPKVGGRDVLVQLRKDVRLNTIPVIIFSTTIDSPSSSELLKLGAAYCLPKPQKFTMLCDIIRDITSGRLLAEL